MPAGQLRSSVGMLGNAKCFTPKYMPMNLPPTVCSLALAVDAPTATSGIPSSGKSSIKSLLARMRSRSAFSSSDAASWFLEMTTGNGDLPANISVNAPSIAIVVLPSPRGAAIAWSPPYCAARQIDRSISRRSAVNASLYVCGK